MKIVAEYLVRLPIYKGDREEEYKIYKASLHAYYRHP